jgi:DNA-3-methyladenine glycosylase II
MTARPLTIRTYAALEAALDRLCTEDRRLGALRRRLGNCTVLLRRAPPGFPTLLRIIVYQQISLQAAGAIWQRLEGVSATPAAVFAQGSAGLGRLGLSRPKARAVLGIAEAVDAGTCALERLGGRSDDEARAALMSLPGIGPWTAEIYLLTALARADAFPAGDIALQEAARGAFGIAARPSAAELEALAHRWRPHRSAAARLLWTAYRADKAMIAKARAAFKLAP